MMLYVSLEQEVAVKQLFTNKGWGYNKPDLRMMTGDIGPLMEETVQTKVVTQAPSQEIVQKHLVVENSQEMVQIQTSVQASDQIMEQSNDVVQPPHQEIAITETPSEAPSQQQQQTQSVEIVKRPKRTPKRNPKYEDTAEDSKSGKKNSKTRLEKSHPKVEVNIDKSNKDVKENSEFQEILQEAEMIAASLSNIENENYSEFKTSMHEKETDNIAAGQFKVKVEQYTDEDDMADFDTQVDDNIVENTGEIENVPSSSKTEPEAVSVGTSASRTSSSKKRKLTGKIVASQGETKKKRGKIRSKYDAVQMSKAYHAIVEKKMSIYRASREYDVPESTLRDRLKERIPFYEDKLPAIGSGYMFNREEEITLAEHFNHMSYGIWGMDTLQRI